MTLRDVGALVVLPLGGVVTIYGLTLTFLRTHQPWKSRIAADGNPVRARRAGNEMLAVGLAVAVVGAVLIGVG